MEFQKNFILLEDCEQFGLVKSIDSKLEKLFLQHCVERWSEECLIKKMDTYPLLPGNYKWEILLSGIETTQEPAHYFKGVGDIFFKSKIYNTAIINYINAVHCQTGKLELNTILLYNIALAYFHSKDYCVTWLFLELVLKINPHYTKALMLGATTTSKLEMLELAIWYCNRFLNIDSENAKVINLRNRCGNDIIAKQEMRTVLFANMERYKEIELIDAIINRGLRIDGAGKYQTFSLHILKPRAPQLENSMVSLNKDQKLVWPVIWIYSQFRFPCYLQKFVENVRFRDYFNKCHDKHPYWSSGEGKFPDNLSVYFEDKTGICLHLVDINHTLGDILSNPRYLIKKGTPKFFIVEKGSGDEQSLLKQYYG